MGDILTGCHSNAVMTAAIRLVTPEINQ